MRRLFSQAHTVRYDECDCEGVLTPAAFLRYMQDIAACDAEDAQLEGAGFWVVKRTVMEFAAPVTVHTPLELHTFGLGFTRITAQRGYEAHPVRQPDAGALLSARTLWVYVDQRGRPARLPERTAQIWLPDETVTPQAEAAFPPTPDVEPAIAQRRVGFSDIDLARHLNNASAVEMLDDAAWEALARYEITPDKQHFTIQSYDIEYVDSPRFGDELLIQTWFEPFPVPHEPYFRTQQIVRDGKLMVRARSRWSWSE